MVIAERVKGLYQRQQNEIAERIRNGEGPKQVVADYLRNGSNRHRNAGDAFNAFAKHLKIGVADLRDRTDKVYRVRLYEELEVLQEARAILEHLIDRGESVTEEEANSDPLLAIAQDLQELASSDILDDSA
jgi:hypothetical protein